VPRVFRHIATLALFVAVAAAAGCSGKGGRAGQDVAATVNGKEIKLAEVMRIVNQQLQGQPLSLPEQAAARIQVLDNLIQREAIVQKAEKEKTMPSDDEINAAINSQKSRATAEEWRKFLEDNKFTEEQLREEARKDLAVKKLQEKLFGQITIRDQEVAEYYNNNRARFVNPRGVGLAVIAVDPRDSGGAFQNDARSDAEATAKINGIAAQLKTGADFGTVAGVNSEDPSRVRGGDIGFADEEVLTRYGFPPELINRLFNTMRVGDVTDPIRLPDSRWIILKLANRQLENRPRAFEDQGVKEEIKQALVEARQSILQYALIRSALAEATIVNNLAEDMLKDPNMLGGMQQVTPNDAATPAASPAVTGATPAATDSPAAAASPAGAAAPAAGAATPAAGATPRAAAATPTPRAAATPRPASPPPAASPAATPGE